MSISKIFCMRVSCLTVSKALEKSMDTSTTYSLSFNKFVICWSKSTTAAVVDPVGLKANWSSIDDAVGCCRRAGEGELLTTSLSTIRDRTGSTKIGRYSDGCFGALVFV